MHIDRFARGGSKIKAYVNSRRDAHAGMCSAEFFFDDVPK